MGVIYVSALILSIYHIIYGRCSATDWNQKSLPYVLLQVFLNATGNLEVKSVYKGEEHLRLFINKINGSVSESGKIQFPANAVLNITNEEYRVLSNASRYMIFQGNVVHNHTAGKLQPWSPQIEKSTWKNLGWSEWTYWGPCSISCGGGIQQRRRHCHLATGCESYNIEQRNCNEYDCIGAVNLLTISQTPPLQWRPTPDRPTARRLRPSTGGYLFLPGGSVYPTENGSTGLPQEYTIITTLKTDIKTTGQGTIISLRSHRTEGSYMSLEMAAHGSVRVVHADRTGSEAIIVTDKMAPGHWHQLAVSITATQVICYLDCQLQGIYPLVKDSFAVPHDVDFIVGYLLQGDLEELIVLPYGNATHLQCSKNSVAIVDKSVDVLTNKLNHAPQHKKRKKKKKKRKHHRKTTSM